MLIIQVMPKHIFN